MNISENLNYVENMLLIQNDTIYAGCGDDSVTLYGGIDYVQMGSGNDTAAIYGGNSFVQMGTGNDYAFVQIDGVDDNVVMRGGNGFDVLRVRLSSEVDVFNFIEARNFERIETEIHWEW